MASPGRLIPELAVRGTPKHLEAQVPYAVAT